MFMLETLRLFWVLLYPCPLHLVNNKSCPFFFTVHFSPPPLLLLFPSPHCLSLSCLRLSVHSPQYPQFRPLLTSDPCPSAFPAGLLFEALTTQVILHTWFIILNYCTNLIPSQLKNFRDLLLSTKWSLSPLFEALRTRLNKNWPLPFYLITSLPYTSVIESKLVLLAAQQANNRETSCWGKA